MLSQTLHWLQAPGARSDFQFSAPNQMVHDVNTDGEDVKQDQQASTKITDSYVSLVKPKLLDRWLDRVVELSGSEYVYLTVLTGLFVWAFLGIPYGQVSTYKITISDAQAIINLVFDAFLMRQQFNQHENLIMATACLRSRINSHKRMIGTLIATGRFSKIDAANFQSLQQAEFKAQLPLETWATKFSSIISESLGHIVTVIGFWICIFIWLGFGPYCGWSNTWQLDINSATSALMVLLLAFLANVRERHSRYSAECLEAIWKADSALELRLRTLTGDTIENCVIVVPQRQRNKIQRAIDYYADLVGTLAGVAILVVIVLIWLACGPVLHFNSSWWLLIGTYAGLVGLNDGFVLRNICQVLGDYEDEQFLLVNHEDADTLAIIGVEVLAEERVTVQSLSYRMSVRVGYFCSHQRTVILGVIFICGLIISATGLRWSETGQLLCNVPPSIIESFFTLILITGHNVGEAKRRVDLSNIYLRRLKVLSYIDAQSCVQACPEGDKANGIDEIRTV